MTQTPFSEAERANLAKRSARWGNDLDLVQGQGGNTSIKSDTVLLVKASGKRLGDACDEDIFVECALEACQAAFAAADEAAAGRAVLPGTTLRPSIETLMHAILPERAVFHFHCVNTIAHTVTTDGMAAAPGLVARLDAVGLKTALTGYAKPGLPLAQAMHAAPSGTSVWLLANHGVVIQAPDLATLDARLARFLDVVRRAPAGPVEPGARSRSEDAGWTLLSGPDVSLLCAGLARMPGLRQMTLYPDHAVILGPGIPGGPEAEGATWYVDTDRAVIGVRTDRAAALMPMIECLIRVVLRLPEDLTDTDLRALGPDDVTSLLNWDAEVYRQAMLRAQGA